MASVHGLAVTGDGDASIFHFGFSCLMNHFQQSQERVDIELIALTQKYRATLFLLDRAAQYFEECDSTLKEDHHIWETADGRHVSELAPFMKAMDDAPLFLDSILNYLRTLADVHAGLVRKLYGEEGRNTIRGGDPFAGKESFTAHRSWFLNKAPDFDPDYAAILRDHSWWFDALAGRESSQEAPALRDLLSHRLATYTHSFTAEGYHPNVSGWKAGVTVDARKLLRIIVHQYFDMLDASYALFLPRVESDLTDAMPIRTDFMHVHGGPWFSSWFYPRIQPPSDARDPD